MLDDFYSQSATGKVISVCWLPPEAGLSYNDPNLLFLTGTGGSTQEISLWSINNPDFAKASNSEFECHITEIGSLKHKGDVNCIKPLGTGGVLTGSSDGSINYYRLTGDELGDNSDISRGTSKSRILVHAKANYAHVYDNNKPAPCTAISAQASYGFGADIASSGEDGCVVFLKSDSLSVFESRVVDHMGVSDLKWQNQFQLVTSTFGGKIKVLDKRSPDSFVQAFEEDSLEHTPITAFDIHPSLNYLVATANSNGTVKIFDLRNSKSTLVSKSLPGYAPYWDIQFVPQLPNNLVATSEIGTLVRLDYKVNLIDNSVATEIKTRDTYSHSLNQLSINALDCNINTQNGLILCGTDSESVLIKRLKA